MGAESLGIAQEKDISRPSMPSPRGEKIAQGTEVVSYRPEDRVVVKDQQPPPRINCVPSTDDHILECVAQVQRDAIFTESTDISVVTV